MGYTTDFTGRFILNRKLDDKLYNYLCDFAETRRMKRSLPEDDYGIEGEFYVGGGRYQGIGEGNEDPQAGTIINSNEPPRTQPGLWCQWIPSDDQMGIEWDGGEKFYEYVEWLEYIVKNFLTPNGYYIRGVVGWQGENTDDIGLIVADGIHGIKTEVDIRDNSRITHNVDDVSSLWLSEEVPPPAEAEITDIFKTGGVIKENSKRRIAGISGEGKNVISMENPRISRARKKQPASR